MFDCDGFGPRPHLHVLLCKERTLPALISLEHSAQSPRPGGLLCYMSNTLYGAFHQRSPTRAAPGAGAPMRI